MADNVSITPGQGALVGTDQRTISGSSVHVQRVDEQGATAIASAQVAVGTSATLLAAARDTRKAILVFVDDAASGPVYVGGAGVTTGTGVKVSAGHALEIATTAAVYGVVSSGSVTVYVLEEYDA
jgi:phenylpyruvate tautomerase PptA (4-oxalocrotonate tautomerase family)